MASGPSGDNAWMKECVSCPTPSTNEIECSQSGKICVGNGKIYVGNGKICVGNGKICVGNGKICVGNGKICVGNGKIQVCVGNGKKYVLGMVKCVLGILDARGWGFHIRRRGLASAF